MSLPLSPRFHECDLVLWHPVPGLGGQVLDAVPPRGVGLQEEDGVAVLARQAAVGQQLPRLEKEV